MGYSPPGTDNEALRETRDLIASIENFSKRIEKAAQKLNVLSVLLLIETAALVILTFANLFHV